MALQSTLRAALAIAVALATTMGVSASGSSAPANDDLAQAHMVDTVFESGRFALNTEGATLEPDEPPAADWIKIDATVWYVVKFGVHQVSVDTFGSDFDTILCAYSPASNGQLFPVTSCNDDAPGYGLTSAIWFDVVPGKAYYIQAGGYRGATGNLVLNVYGTATGNYLPVASPV